MANNFNLILDTTAPSAPSILIESGSAFTTANLVNVTISTGDGDTTGYQMKIWGNVDISQNANIQDIEVSSTWITYNTSQQVKLSTGDGIKTLFVKIRDDVWNESAQASDTIQLDTTLPTVTITGPDRNKISRIVGKDQSAFSFSVDVDFVEYKVKVVSAAGAAENTGVQIPIAGGSTNMSGIAGGYLAATPINCMIDGDDLFSASAGDGTKIVKVFVKDSAGLWSV